MWPPRLINLDYLVQCDDNQKSYRAGHEPRPDMPPCGATPILKLRYMIQS